MKGMGFFIMLIKKGITIILIILFLSLTTLVVSANLTITRNIIGVIGDFDFEFWRESEGEGSMTVFKDGTFECSWNDVDVILFRTGKKMGNPGGRRTSNIFKHEEYGDIYISYAADFQPDGNSYLCVYGWTVDPLVEFYIIESWGSWHPTGDDHMGTVKVDGGTYDVYVTMRVEEASINGTQTFPQFWSVRKNQRTDGTISVSEHFKLWDDMGMELGKMFEVAFCVEGIGSSGEANVYKHFMTIGDDKYGEGTHFARQPKAAFNPVPVVIIAIGILVAGVVVHSCIKKT